jgi:peptidoglycan/LPS O-acetylase OafA/YrhL
MERSRKNNFDLIRLVLASLVFLYHSYVLSGAAELKYLQHSPALLAVQSFFAISGYLIFASYETSASKTDYLLKRCKRVYPAYAFVIIISIIVCSFLSTHTLASYWTDRQTLKYFVFNIVFLNFKAPNLPGVFEDHIHQAINGSLWTLKLEVMFYFSVPVIHYFIGKYGYRRPLAMALAASIAFRLICMHLAKAQNYEFYIKLATQFPGQLSYFLCGTFIYYFMKDGKRMHPLLPALGLAAYIGVHGAAFWILSPPAIALVTIYAATHLPVLEKPKGLGDLSYGVYIYHFPILQSVIALGLFSSLPLLGLLTAALCLGFLAFLSWHWLESPALRWSLAPARPRPFAE